MKTCNGAALFPDTEMMSRTEGYKSNEAGREGDGFEVGEEVAGPCRLLPKPKWDLSTRNECARR